MKNMYMPLRYPFLLFITLIFIKICFVRVIVFDRFGFIDALYIELPMIIILCSMIELIRKGKLWIYFAFNTLVTFVFFIIVVYYQYFGSIVTYTSLWSANQVGDVGASIALLIKPYFLLIFLDLPILLIGLILYKKKWVQLIDTHFTVQNKYSAGVIVLSFVLVIYHALNSIGGDIINEIKKAESMGLISYEAYVVYADLKRDYSPEYSISLRSIQNVKEIAVPEEPKYHGIARDQDIYVVQLEAIQNFLVGLTIEGIEVTPHMNQLVKESFYFPKVYQQIGKGNTSDAEFITNTSTYPSGQFPMSKEFGHREVPSLPRYLSPLGYESVTLHTNAVHFWDRNLMYDALGFDKYYDIEYFGEDDFLVFGASDEVLYDKSIDIFLEMKARNQRIYANLIAMSSHSPFEIPEEKNPFPLPEHLEGTMIGQYIQAGHYADHALGMFIEDLKATGLWDSALLVVNGDHFGFASYAPEEDRELAAEILGLDEYTTVDVFNIPLIIRVPGHDQPQVIESVGGQVDYLPTIANLIGLPLEDKIYFGQDLLNHSSNLIPERVYLPTGSFINDEVMFIPGKGFNDGTMLPLEEGFELPDDKEPYREDFNRALKLLEMSDIYLNSLPKLETSNEKKD